MQTFDTYERLAPAWIIIHGDYTEYSCESHARQFAEEHDTPETSMASYTIQRAGYGTVSDVYAIPSWDRGETDYPASCNCGQYLDIPLTREGVEYMRMEQFPAWLYDAHGITV